MLKYALLFTLVSTAQAESRVPVSVVTFEDKSGVSHCREDWDWWRSHMGSAFQEILTTELVSTYPHIQVLERMQIRQVYEGEHELINAEKSAPLEKGQFKRARYVLAGAVTEFEYCAGDHKGGVDVGAFLGLGSIRVGVAKGKAKAAVDIRLIQTTTGEILKSVRGEGESGSSRLNLGADIHGLGGDFSTRQNSPLALAAREAIRKTLSELTLAIR